MQRQGYDRGEHAGGGGEEDEEEREEEGRRKGYFLGEEPGAAAEGEGGRGSARQERGRHAWVGFLPRGLLEGSGGTDGWEWGMGGGP